MWKLLMGQGKGRNEQDDNDATMKNMMTFMFEDRKLELENRMHELAAQIQIWQMEEQAQRDDRIASEQARSKDMYMRQQEFRMMNIA